ncbi:histidine phosphatase family protein [Methylopila turkensis]|uniref:Phosphoglycerate mutase n=1 Tax=Methylopila turkensis TaxID=1437816 RepID=A0A9W6JLU3_9HYPH|nr:histidine phosphatase family protein [Methylopila turkensis]GLK78573.1 phosphoglycerate mutase [Methylopila turkensis]
MTRVFLLAAFALIWSPAMADDEALWRALREGGHVALMRHATAPGVGDPTNFRIGDCSTQRNLSDAGRREAKAVGERFRAAGVAVGRVVSSQWCRARETAEAMALGPVIEDPRLNSFFEIGDRRAAIAASRQAVLDAPRSGPITVFVTHQVNVTALTDVYPASAEIVVAKLTGAGFEVVGSIKP